MQSITLLELAEVYGVSDRTLNSWKKLKVDVYNPSEVYAHVAGLSRRPEKLRDHKDALQRFEELANRKLAESDTDFDGGEVGDLAEQMLKEKLRKLTAEANRIEFLLAQSKNEFVSLADDVAPSVTQIFGELLEEVDGSYAELGELCDKRSGNEIMAKGQDLLREIRTRYHGRLMKFIEDLQAA